MMVVTGASDGLGLQVARVYKEAHKYVVNISRRKSEYATTDILADLTNAEDIKKAVKRILAMRGRAD